MSFIYDKIQNLEEFQNTWQLALASLEKIKEK